MGGFRRSRDYLVRMCSYRRRLLAAHALGALRQHLLPQLTDKLAMARVGRHHVSDVLTDTQSSFGRSSPNIIVYGLNQPSDGHDSIAFVWLRHVSHSCSPNLKRTETRRTFSVRSLGCDCEGLPACWAALQGK